MPVNLETENASQKSRLSRRWVSVATPTRLSWLRAATFMVTGTGLLMIAAPHWFVAARKVDMRPQGFFIIAVGLLVYLSYAAAVRRLMGLMCGAVLLSLALTYLHTLAEHGSIGEWRPVDSVSILLAVGAVAVGVYHVREIKRTIAQLTTLQSALSTRYIGKFPDFLATIVDELQRANRSISIFCDFPAYGYFSDYKTALKYKQVLETKRAENVAIELTCLDASKRAQTEDEQFAPDSWVQWQSDLNAKAKLNQFLTRRLGETAAASAKREEFLQALNELDASFLQDVFQNTAVEIGFDIPIYFWIIDGRTAVFAISARSDRESWEEYGFVTSDHALIQAFQELSVRYREKVRSQRST